MCVLFRVLNEGIFAWSRLLTIVKKNASDVTIRFHLAKFLVRFYFFYILHFPCVLRGNSAFLGHLNQFFFSCFVI